MQDIQIFFLLLSFSGCSAYILGVVRRAKEYFWECVSDNAKQELMDKYCSFLAPGSDK
jgi:hypothetical protein